MESLLSHDPNRDTPACFPCPDAPLSPPQSPVVLVAPGAPLRPARKRRIDDDLMKWIVEELGIYHLNVLRLRAEHARLRARPAAPGPPGSHTAEHGGAGDPCPFNATAGAPPSVCSIAARRVHGQVHPSRQRI